MVNYPIIVQALTPNGDPLPIARHREEYYNTRIRPVKAAHNRASTMPSQAPLLRAGLMARIGRFIPLV